MKCIQILCAMVLLLSGCSSTNENKGKTLLVALSKDPPTIDTRKSSDTVSSILHFLLNCGLTHVTENNEVVNDLADSISISEDQLQYTFKLKKAYWSDGSRITAKDFENNWKQLLSPDFPAPNCQMFYCIQNARKAKENQCLSNEIGVAALDQETLQVTLESPTPYFLRLTAFCPFFPMKKGAKGEHISSGPFTLEKWRHNDELVLKANPKYHNHQQVGADTIKLLIVENEGTALKMYEQGEIDYIGGVLCSLPCDLVGKYMREDKARFMPLAATARLYFNTNIPPFHNTKIRRAISLALNREELIQSIAPFPAEVATGIVPPLLKRPQATPPTLEGDALALLQEGLEEEGLESLPEINLLYAFSEMNNKVVQVVQEQLHKKLGLNMVLEGLDFKHYLARLKGRQFVMTQGKWIAQFNDPVNILDCFKYRGDWMNIPSWENKTYIKYLEESAYITDPDERLKVLEKAEQILSDELPICPLFHWSDYYLMNPEKSDVYICSTRPPTWKKDKKEKRD